MLPPLLSYLLPDWLIECVARGSGYFARLTRPGSEYSLEARVRGRLVQPRIGGRGFSLGRHALLIGTQAISVGRGVTIHPGTQIVAGRTGKVSIGSHSHVSRNSVLAGSGGISIGENCKISSGVMIYSVTYERNAGGLLRDAPPRFAPVSIGNDVHIGANATLLPGVTVGDNATIGAGAVVTRNVAAGATVVGIPARPVTSQGAS